MKYIFTDIFKDFACVGGKCIDSCCFREWGILVDDITYQKYASLEEPLRSYICSHIEKTEQGYRIIEGSHGRCPFLNQQNLCDIYSMVSPEAMCDTCRIYPRKIEQYYDVVMGTMFVSCPEVARMLLEKETPIMFCFTEDQGENVSGNVDWILYNELINGLVTTTDILQDRDLALWQRFQLVLIVTSVIQEHIEKNDLTSLRETIECFRDKEYRRRMYEEYQVNPLEGRESWRFIYSLFEHIFSDKNASAGQETFEDRFRSIGAEDERTYQEWNNEFKSMDLNIEYENLTVQFIFEYYMDALKGESLYINVVKMLVLLILIRTQEVIEYHLKRELSVEDKALIIANTSEMMEHSNMLETLAEEIVKRNEKEMLFVLLGALS
ncbi:MAG: flagellin lysine-N-methylase [Acetatifactor sp.]|nr:flagellin lysine-N-methylase [Acetatifactor sp.]